MTTTQVLIQLDSAVKANVPIIVQLVGPPSTNTAHGPDGEIFSTYREQRTNSAGRLVLDLTRTDELVPAGCFWRITAKTSKSIARWNIYLDATNAAGPGPYEIGLQALQVVSPIPPDWAPVATIVDIDLLAPIIDNYAQAAVDAALEADPVLKVDQALAELIDVQELARQNINAAPADATAAALQAVNDRIDPFAFAESEDPALRRSSRPTLVAASALSGHRMVTTDTAGEAVYASNDDAGSKLAPYMITSGAVEDGAEFQPAIPGDIVDGGPWTWTPRDPVYLGTNGVLTQTPPTAPALFLLRVGTALTADSLYLEPDPPITL